MVYSSVKGGNAVNKTRIEKLGEHIKKANLGGMLICPSEELLYLTGSTPKMCKRFQGLFLCADGRMFYVCNILYGGEIENNYKGNIKVFTWIDGEPMTEIVRDALSEFGLLGQTLGTNYSAQAFNVLDIARDCNVKFINGLEVLEEARIIKTAAEVEDLRRAAGIADNAFTQVLGFIKPGLKEEDIFLFLCKSMQEAGGINPWAIVASGPNSSYPHYSGLDRLIEKKDLMILDFGCTVNGMCSDMSRTVFVGGISDEEKKIYSIVKEAYEAAATIAVNGAFIPDIDKAARDIIAQAGYGKCFVNRVGHGIGYMIHEGPYIRKDNKRKLEPGMAFSIEPGIYLAGHLGMRIENIILTTETGNEILNKSNKEIIIL